MTPWNIVGMAKVKGLDVIALTDHNCARNLPQAMLAGRAYGVQVLAGIEITAKEDVHLLAYFADTEAAVAFGEEVYTRLPDITNRADLFGNQIIIGDDDEQVGLAQKLLLNAIDLSADEIDAWVCAAGGVCVPAHINRGANGMIGALGLMPPLPRFPVVEVCQQLNCSPDAVKGRLVLHASDAHQLADIAEQGFSLDVPAPTAKHVFDYLKQR